jgi:hypothetical protein
MQAGGATAVPSSLPACTTVDSVFEVSATNAGGIMVETVANGGMIPDPGPAAVTVMAASTTAAATTSYKSCKQVNMSRSAHGNNDAVAAGTENGEAHVKALVKSSTMGRTHESHVHDGQSLNLSTTTGPSVTVVANKPDDEVRGKDGQPLRSLSRGNISDNDKGDELGPLNVKAAAEEPVTTVNDGGVSVCAGVETEVEDDEGIANTGATDAVACDRGIKTWTSAGGGA